MMEVAQMLDEVIAAGETFISNTVALGHGTWKFGYADSVDGRLVSLEIS
jgi:hypothetical protein